MRLIEFIVLGAVFVFINIVMWVWRVFVGVLGICIAIVVMPFVLVVKILSERKHDKKRKELRERTRSMYEDDDIDFK